MPAPQGWTTVFQSTCLREARLGDAVVYPGGADFNPRAYVRHDDGVTRPHLPGSFQSTCLREARQPLQPEPAC